jgi:plastocyanin
MSRRTLVILITLVIVVVGAALGFGFAGGKSAAGDCRPGAGSVSHTVTITNSQVSNADVHGRMCDTLTFVNKDRLTREIAFGPHDDHVPYDGVGERVLNQGQSFTITLNQLGKYHWHDHLHDDVEGYFTVVN